MNKIFRISASFLGLFLLTAAASAQAGEVTLMAVGDILPQASWQRFCIPVSELFKNVNSTFYGADVVIGNLETPLTDRKEMTKGKDPESVKNGKDFVFRCTGEQAANDLKDAGLTVLTLANNHMMDYGTAGLLDTLKKLEKAGMKVAGAGRDKDAAEAPCIVEAGGTRFVILSGSDVVPRGYEAAANRPGISSIKDDGALLAHIVTARQDYPDAVIVVCVHWGVEATYVPTERQKTLAHDFVDAGADIVIGHHPHRVQGVDYYNGKPIFYSLGNFQFDTKGAGNETFIAKVVYKDGSLDPSSVTIMPVFIEKGGFPRVLAEDEAEYKAIRDRVDELCRQLGPGLKWNEIVPAQKPAAY